MNIANLRPMMQYQRIMNIVTYVCYAVTYFSCRGVTVVLPV